MSRKAKRNLIIGCIGAAVYLALLFALVAVESAAPEATITSVTRGLWYTVTTLTTVGYGDMYPVTAAGKTIGVIFQLMSLGLLVALVGAMVTFLRGSFLPKARLRAAKNKRWYVFSERNRYSEALAEKLEESDPKGFAVFADSVSSDDEETAGFDAPFCLSSVLKIKKDPENISLFAMGGNMSENERLSEQFGDGKMNIYCLSEHEPEHLPANRVVFDPYRCCARSYWNTYPLSDPNETIAIIGEGKYAFALLEQALILNVISDKQSVVYSVYGDHSLFRDLHPYLDTAISIDDTAKDRDSLLFKTVPWSADLDTIKETDRLIVCFDDEERATEVLTALYRYCPVQGKVYARLSVPFDNTVTFGSAEEVFTPEYVCRDELDRTAVKLHEMYLASSPGKLPGWNDLGTFLRRSNLASADHMETKIHILLGFDAGNKVTDTLCAQAYEKFRGLDEEGRCRCRKIEHDRWTRFHVVNNWQYAPVRDNEKRLHPLIVPFDRLSPEEQAKDDYAWEILGTYGRASSTS